MNVNLNGVASFVELAELADFPLVGENSRTYIALDSNLTYHWSGADYIPVVVGSGAAWGGITGTLSAQTDLQNELDLKVDEAAGERLINAAEIVILGNTSNTNSGNETAATIGAVVDGATDYATPLDADKIGIFDVANSLLKAVTWTNVKATLKSYFDTLYNLYTHPNHSGDVTSAGDGAQTIAANAVTNAKLAQMATKTYKGRTSALTGNAEDVAVATLKTDLDLSNTNSGDQTFFDARIQSVVSAATVTATSTNDLVIITAQAAALTLANPTGAFTQGQKLIYRIKDDGTARAISYGNKFRVIGITLPTTTVVNKTTYIGVIYNATDDKFDALATGTEA